MPDQASASGLSIESVVKRFGGLTALSNVTCRVKIGSLVGLIGPNGSGKSTLLNVINGHVVPDSGRVLWMGNVLSGRQPRMVAKHGVMRTFQSAHLLDEDTVETNIQIAAEAYGSPSWWSNFRDLIWPRHDLDAERQLAVANSIAEFQLKAWSVRQLSLTPGGVRNLVSLATSVVAPGLTGERLYLLDEPFAGLEEAIAFRIAGEITRLRDRGSTVVIVDHRLSVVRRICDELIVLNSGSLIAQGPTEDVLANHEVIGSYMGGGAGVA